MMRTFFMVYVDLCRNYDFVLSLKIIGLKRSLHSNSKHIFQDSAVEHMKQSEVKDEYKLLILLIILDLLSLVIKCS